MKKANPTILALDLEGTLISNAMSQIPRPGLHYFLNRCALLFPRMVMFTTVREDKFRQIARLLVEENVAPEWFLDIEYINWQGETKNLEFVPAALVSDIVLVDDFEKYLHPGQEAQWMQIDYFDYPYPDDDTGLFKVLQKLETLVVA
ncbi:NIF family HAD-type phosphatase [Undibacterium sp. Ji50W]|uniref:NIF family HAD-type phosphatase n=1 Tax=Undibacterium sp. Ji50W TaxID=3413041 RepID=UPI003BF40B08